MASVSRVELKSGALTASANGSSIALESFSKSFVGWLHVSACHAATTVAAKIQHSADGTNWVDLETFTNVVGTTGVQAGQITEAVLPFVRGAVTLSGATQSATVLMSLYFDKEK